MPPKAKHPMFRHPQRTDIGTVARWYGNMWNLSKIQEGKAYFEIAEEEPQPGQQTKKRQEFETKLREKEKELKELQEQVLEKSGAGREGGNPSDAAINRRLRSTRPSPRDSPRKQVQRVGSETGGSD